jgi:copper homeostasis protein
MPARPLLEICVESIEHAAAAGRGGADRIELCADLSVEGVTPSANVMRAARDATRVPIHVLIRPRPGDFVYSGTEFEQIQAQILLAKDLGMDGIVLGVLDESGRIDRERTAFLIKRADPLPVTFHRAFDLCTDLKDAMEAVIETGAKRILTSGGKARVVSGLTHIAELVALAGNRIVIMPGGGVRAGNIKRILQETAAREVHSSLGAAANGPGSKPRSASCELKDAEQFEAKVRTIRQMMDTITLVNLPG